MAEVRKIGGARPGAGRPKGSRNRRSLALADRLQNAGKCPAEALVRIAEEAEAAGNLALAVDAWKAVLPYVHAKPKPVETAPDAAVDLARGVAEARRAATQGGEADWAILLEDAWRRASDLHGRVAHGSSA